MDQLIHATNGLDGRFAGVAGSIYGPDGAKRRLRASYTANTISLVVACGGDFSGSGNPDDPGYGVADGNVDATDFFYFLDQFAGGNLAKADLTGSGDPDDPNYLIPNGGIDATDFFVYLDLFVQGCN